MAISWRPLHVASAVAHLPPLLISTAFLNSSYTIHLTDLTHIWVESLDHAAILERAEEENTSIDPGERSQLQILLSKIGLALCSGPKTSLNLQIEPQAGHACPGITLHLTVELPGGLAPLEWPIRLTSAPQSVLTDRLTGPLLQAQHARVRELESLKEVLKEKDHIIQKLMDRMEAMGTDLGQIFPQANMKGGRKVDKARAEEKVRGLRPFDMESWRKEAGDLANVFTDDTNFDLSLDSVAKENWWETVRGSRIDISKNRASLSRTTQSKPALKQKESSEDDDGFQVQLTPPGRASKGSIALDDSMREEDLGAPSQLSKVPDSFPQPEALSRQKFGILGGQKDEPKKPLPITDVSTDDEETTSPRSKQIGAVKLSPQEETSTDDEELPMNRSRQQFGKIGSQKPSLLEETSTDDDEVPLPYPTKQLGRVGGQNVPLLDEDEVSLPRSNQQSGMAGEQQARLLENASTDDDEPRPSKSGRAKENQPGKVRATPLADEETTDDDAPAPALPRGQSLTNSPSPPPPKTSTTMKTKLGTLGGKKEPPPPVEKPNLKKAKLGQVGGKKKESTPPRSAPSSPEGPPTQTPKRKLGAFGGRHKAAHEGNDAADAAVRESTGRSLEVRALKDEAQPARETSEERVVKKRRELKRELEEKAKAPIKKKRKF